MRKRRRGKTDKRAASEGETGQAAPAWHAGHLPRIPRDPSDEDFVTGWFHERLLDGLADDSPEAGGH